MKLVERDPKDYLTRLMVITSIRCKLRPETELSESKRVERFFDKILVSDDGCWLWIGSLKPNGYAKFKSQHTQYAHRYAYYAFKGDLVKGMYICHTCDNPRCVNPDHLWQGTPAQNILDCIAKGRKKSGITDWKIRMESKPHHWQKLTRDQVIEIKKLLLVGEMSRRQIAECFNIDHDHVGQIQRGERWAHLNI